MRTLRKIGAALSLLVSLPGNGEPVEWKPNHNDPPIKDEELAKVEAGLPEKALAKPAEKRRLLIYSATAGFRHASIPVGKVALTRIGEKTGAYDAVVSDDLGNFEKEQLEDFDAVLLLNSSGAIFMPNQKKKDQFTDEQWKWLRDRHNRLVDNLVAYVEEGGGLSGIHAATDACYGNHSYTETIGGLFAGHPWNANQEVTIVVTDPEHEIIKPVFKGREDITLKEEIYQFKEGTASAEKLRILLHLDPERSEKPIGKKPNRKDNDFPVCWVQKVGKGRVFYTSIGHRHDVYWNPLILEHYLAGLQFALGDIEADTTPSAQVELPNLTE